MGNSIDISSVRYQIKNAQSQSSSEPADACVQKSPKVFDIPIREGFLIEANEETLFVHLAQDGKSLEVDKVMNPPVQKQQCHHQQPNFGRLTNYGNSNNCDMEDPIYSNDFGCLTRGDSLDSLDNDILDLSDIRNMMLELSREDKAQQTQNWVQQPVNSSVSSSENRVNDVILAKAIKEFNAGEITAQQLKDIENELKPEKPELSAAQQQAIERLEAENGNLRLASNPNNEKLLDGRHTVKKAGVEQTFEVLADGTTIERLKNTNPGFGWSFKNFMKDGPLAEYNQYTATITKKDGSTINIESNNLDDLNAKILKMTTQGSQFSL
ncbi:MAG: hypothetical protein A2104_01510 [Candidatus Melainabacteria bacterium GWF2_32_7]|nr:MAG: hypothetical protein A2104_01510 [Candidatus Melainabacteria bacterium GWF2_32_7]